MRAGWKVLLMMSVGVAVGCGNPRPPEPPALELPQRVRDLQATRKADKVYLSWSIPRRTTEAESILYYGNTRICRGAQEALTECGTPAGEAPAPTVGQRQAIQAGANPKETYIDILPPNLSVSATGDLTYAIEVLNEAGRSAGLSNQVHVPAAPTLPPPVDFHAELTPDAVKLTWMQMPMASNKAGLQYGIRIYRKNLQTGQEILLANEPMDVTQYLDQTFEWEKRYAYHATVVTEITQAMPCPAGASPECGRTAYVEGADTPSEEVSTHDVFPPPVPSGLQAVFSGPGQQPFIDLIWNSSAAADLAGYNVYRREDHGTWEKINPELIKAPAYRDTNIQPGKKYFYSVVAVDMRGNESARSEETSENVPLR